MVLDLREKEQTLQKLYDQARTHADELSRFSRSVFESMTSGVVDFDHDGHLTYLNRAARDILGIDAEQSRGRPACEVFGSASPLVSILDDALRRGVVHSRAEVPLTRRDGVELWLGLSSSLLQNPPGSPRGVVFLLSDLTEIRRLRQQVSLKERLAALGEISAGIVHEFRNSLGTILGFARLLERQPHPPGLDDIIRAIVRESVNLEGTLEEFLVFTHPDRLNLEEISLIDTLQETLASIGGELADRGIRHLVQAEEHLPPVQADQLLLQRALLNLFHNSMEAIEGPGEIRVDAHLRAGDELVEIRIKDSGCGIPPENLGRIFMPFYTTKAKGFGLGLGIVQKIVLAHQGFIEVQSQPGRGTEFRILLPVRSRDRSAAGRLEDTNDIDNRHRVWYPEGVAGTNRCGSPE
jgi:PAS domain S-box-containing protein